MPNARRKDKVKVNVWMTDQEKKLLEEAAKKHGCKSVTEFLQSVANGTLRIAPALAAMVWAILDR